MNPLRYGLRVLNYLIGFFFYGLLCVLMQFIALPINLLPETLRRRCQSFSRRVVRLGFAFTRWYCRVSGFAEMRLIDHSEGRRSPLMLANHISMFDIVLLFGFIPDLQTLVNAKFANNPLMTLTVRACGYIPINVRKPLDGVLAFSRLRDALRAGEPTALFPEGTRSATGQLGPLKPGAFRLIDELGIPPTFIFFTSSQPFLNRAAFFPKSRDRVILEAHIFAAEDKGEESWEQLFRRRYEEFRNSDLALAWNREATRP